MDEDRQRQQAREQDEQSTQRRAAILGVQYLDTRDIEDTLALVEGVLDIDVMHKNRLIPLVAGSDSTPWQFGITTQTPQSFLKELTDKYTALAQNAQFFLISQYGFRALMLRYDPPVQVVYDDITIAKEGDSDTLQQVSDTLNNVGSDQLFDFLISQADRLGASDIHIENQRDNIRVRMRVDGALHSVATIDQDRYRVILATLVSKAGLSTASNEPQSGHMQKELGDGEARHILNMRIEMVPTMYGQDSVIRLFNYDESMLNIDRLGIPDIERKQIDEVISHPRGMVLMVGPTGSGKSTTLYSMISSLNTPDRKIITLEDPIEFGVPGVSQVPVNTTDGQNFADHLRSVLRLDPDVIMIGEIRDADTARTAIQASITGHLVLSTFHANTTAAAFSRMIDLIGVNPIFSTAIRLLIAQRLVRRLDDSTKEAYEPDEATKQWIRTVLKDIPAHVEKPDLENIQLYRPVASETSPFGYSGRMILMEQLVVSENIQKFLRGDTTDVHAEIIENEARKEGMVTLLENGVLAALRGETTIEEVNKVI
mgnify:FL=1|tara:strand:- start:71 stop:1693 length:1623 start_codon:yes stop_codon:yes gene_type:complete